MISAKIKLSALTYSEEKMTLRGYKKNLVVVKNLEGGIIDEAFLLLRDGAEGSEDEIIKEANRIIARTDCIRAIKNAKPRFALPEFLIGLASATVMALTVIFLVL